MLMSVQRGMCTALQQHVSNVEAPAGLWKRGWQKSLSLLCGMVKSFAGCTQLGTSR